METPIAFIVLFAAIPMVVGIVCSAGCNVDRWDYHVFEAMILSGHVSGNRVGYRYLGPGRKPYG
jgi:hypothetical protein